MIKGSFVTRYRVEEMIRLRESYTLLRSAPEVRSVDIGSDGVIQVDIQPRDRIAVHTWFPPLHVTVYPAIFNGPHASFQAMVEYGSHHLMVDLVTFVSAEPGSSTDLTRVDWEAEYVDLGASAEGGAPTSEAKAVEIIDRVLRAISTANDSPVVGD